jgi:GT2 family glycosyltransferase
VSELVSVVIVGHDSWPDLELAIESALNQSHPDVEVIVVDNGSRDRTSTEVPVRYGDRVRYLRQTNRGDGGGYNAGLAVARGDLLQFLDGDDFLAPNKLARQVALFRADPALDVVYGDVRQFQLAAGQPSWVDWDTGDFDDLLLALVAPDMNHAGIMAQSALIHRRALERVGPWDEALYVVDYDYWLRAAWAGCRFRYSPGALAFYQSRPGQMSADVDAMMRGIAAVWAKALTYVDREPYRSILARRLAQRRFYLALADRSSSGRETVAAIAAARALAPGALPPAAIALGCALALAPGGRRLMHVPALAAGRALLQRGFGLR